MFLIPTIRLTAFKYYAFFTSSIALDGEIISPYSYYIKKGLVYIIIADPSSHQPSSYSKYIKSNTCVSCNMRSVSLNKYTFLTHFNSR